MSDLPGTISEPPEPQFLVTSRRDRDRLLVSIRGELDLSTAPQVDAVARAIEGSGAKEAVIDLSEMSFVDSSGILVLLNFDARAKAAGCELKLANPTPWVAQLFELLDLRQAIKITGRQVQAGAARG